MDENFDEAVGPDDAFTHPDTVVDEYEVRVETANEAQYLADMGKPGCYIRETWRVRGKIDREFGPAIITFDPDTSIVNLEEYYALGKRCRMDGPAIIRRDPHSGEVTEARYFECGEEVFPGPLISKPNFDHS